MNLARSGLRLPIILGFVLVVTLPLVVVYAGANRSSVVASHLREHVLPQMAIFELAINLDEKFQVIALTARDIVLSRDMGVKQREKGKFDQARAEFAERLKHLERMVDSATGKEIIARIKKSWSSIEPSMDKAIALGMANKPFEAGEIVLAEMNQDQSNLFKETTSI